MSVEFDVFTWKAGVRLPVFHPETELVPDPTGPRLILEVLHPTKVRGSLGSPETVCLSPVFVPAQYHPSEIDPRRIISYWSVITSPRDAGIEEDREGLRCGLIKATGRWRIWKADVLLRAVDLYSQKAKEKGSDMLKEHVHEAAAWLETNKKTVRGSRVEGEPLT